MKIALITDTHFGGKNDNLAFSSFQRKFYEGTLFPILDREGITTVIHLGDTFDRRKYSNFLSLKLAKEMFFEPIRERGIDLHVLLGNHDCYYKTTNEVNSMSLTCKEYDIHLYEDTPEVINFDGLNVLMTPWIAPDKHAESMRIISKAKADVVMGHLPLQGAEMLTNVYCDDGIERKHFKRFERVFSGHFHVQQDDGHIRYLGAPYEITWNDYNSKKGFHILDTETREVEFFQNPNRLFKKIFYDDGHTCDEMLNMDLSEYEGCYIKVFVIQKTDFYTFDRFIDKCYNEGNFYELKVVEDFSDLDPNSITDEVVEVGEDTMTLLDRYVEEIESQAINKNKLKRLLKNLYVEASEVE